MTTTTPLADAERIHADHTTVKHLGRWTEATKFEVRARRATVVLDLRAPSINWADAVTVHLELARATVKLLLPDDIAVDQRQIGWPRRGRVKDTAPGTGTRRLLLLGTITDGEVRVHRGGMAQLSAMCSRAYLADVRRAHRDGGMPTIDDPSREATK